MRTEEYKYIENLVERFFEGQTSNEEERVLYEFFARPDIPAHLNVIGRYSGISRGVSLWSLARLWNGGCLLRDLLISER